MSKPLTIERCLELGGHCWVRDDMVISTNPYLYHRRCKHCPAVQHGKEQPQMHWWDDDSETAAGVKAQGAEHGQD